MALIHISPPGLGQDGRVTIPQDDYGTLNQSLTPGMALFIELQPAFQGRIRNLLELAVNSRVNLDVATQELVSLQIGAYAGAELFELFENVFDCRWRIDRTSAMNVQTNG